MYSAARRRGLAGWIGFLRGAVYEEGSQTPLLFARSPDVARTLARVLNGEDVHKRVVEDRSPWPRYAARALPRTGRTTIWAEASVHRPGALGDGAIAELEDAELARRLVDMLNEMDPLPRARMWGQF